MSALDANNLALHPSTLDGPTRSLRWKRHNLLTSHIRVRYIVPQHVRDPLLDDAATVGHYQRSRLLDERCLHIIVESIESIVWDS